MYKCVFPLCDCMSPRDSRHIFIRGNNVVICAVKYLLFSTFNHQIGIKSERNNQNRERRIWTVRINWKVHFILSFYLYSVYISFVIGLTSFLYQFYNVFSRGIERRWSLLSRQMLGREFYQILWNECLLLIF
jgi:hypothetical protein